MLPTPVALAAVVVAAACFDPTFYEPRCDQGGACPRGLVCEDMLCVVAGPDAAPADARPAVDAAVDAAELPDASLCPDGYQPFDGFSSRYRVVTDPTMWLVAEVDCENDGTGSHLLVLDDPREDALFTATGAMWAGTSDRAEEGLFLAVTGGATRAGLPWSLDQPDDGLGAGISEDCVVLSGLEVRDDTCDQLLPFVCECDGRAPDASAYTQP